MGDAFGDAAECSESVQTSAAHDEQIRAGGGLDEGRDRGRGCGFHFGMLLLDDVDVDVLSSECDHALKRAVVASCEVGCQLIGALGLIRSVDADDDAAWEAGDIWDGPREEHRACCLVQEFSGDSAEDDLLDSRARGRPDGEQGRLCSLYLLEQ